MTDAPPNLTPNEVLRLSAVRRYDVWNTGSDEDLDNLASLAARLFGSHIGFVSIVDQDRIWFKSRHGLELQEAPREPGLCASAILQDQIWQIEDAEKDDRTAANSLVTGEAGIRFYAGAPLRTTDGQTLGVVGIMDRVPRSLTPEEHTTLMGLAQVVMHELELRLVTKRASDLEASVGELASTLVTDMREALTTIGMVLTSLRTAHLSAKASKQLNLGLAEVQRLRGFLAEIMRYADSQPEHWGEVDMDELIPETLQPLWEVAESKRRAVEYSPPSTDAVVWGDRDKLKQVAQNLLTNAWEAVQPGERIEVNLFAEHERGQVCLDIRNGGKPVPGDILSKITEPFVTTKPRHAGLGLAIVERIVEAHHGELTFESDAVDGTRFRVRLPAAGS